jgi:CheY-like chemotaxis protein
VTPKKPYIFLVEDDADDRFMMQQAFAEHHFVDQVRMFPSSDYFLMHISSLKDASQLPSLIVLDFNMPVMNGGELLIQLKKLEHIKAIPIVLYSTGMRPFLRDMLIATGAQDCFEKGLEFRDLCKLAKTLRMLAEGNEVIY